MQVSSAKTIQSMWRFWLLLPICWQLAACQTTTAGPLLPLTGPSTGIRYGAALPWHPRDTEGSVKLNMQNRETTVRLPHLFPFYGALYNYTRVFQAGMLAFGNVQLQQGTVSVDAHGGPDWPRVPDPALMAVYACPQQPATAPGIANAGVYMQLIDASPAPISNAGGGSSLNFNFRSPFAQTEALITNAAILDRIRALLSTYVAGGLVFEPEHVAIFTWANMTTITANTNDQYDKLSTYQIVWASNRQGSLSYLLLGYEKLGFSSGDVRNNDQLFRCKAYLNGGNATGVLWVDPSSAAKHDASHLALASALPDHHSGVHVFRVDDIAVRVGATTKAHGTYPLVLYPNVISMVNQQLVEVNAMLLDRHKTYRLFIAEEEAVECVVVNQALARCQLPQVWYWGTKDVYFQPDSNGATATQKAFRGYLYFVPPTADPNRLRIGNLPDWYVHPLHYPDHNIQLGWWSANFTYNDIGRLSGSSSRIYSGRLWLQLLAYSEAKDMRLRQAVPHITLLATCQMDISNTRRSTNRSEYQSFTLPIADFLSCTAGDDGSSVWDHIRGNFDRSRHRFGFFRLVPGDAAQASGQLTSSPISLHWLWNDRSDAYEPAVVELEAEQQCNHWYEEDGAESNFIRETEEHASCPCVRAQAEHDYGRFMPHPRCSRVFRDAHCTVNLGSADCYMSAQNIHGRLDGSRYSTTYGQVCCYGEDGLLMHTAYQQLLNTPTGHYNPGFPFRAYEFGTPGYNNMFQVPGLSAFHHDVLPYFFCCSFAPGNCQKFYWRRPTSGCQQYRPPLMGSIHGSGFVSPLSNTTGAQQQQQSNRWMSSIRRSGVYNLLSIPESPSGQSVDIQVRMEHYPDRTVDTRNADIAQQDYVQPSEAVVLTGIAIKVGSQLQDTTYVLLRKDTRRMRYRIAVVARQMLRYFDQMRLQRFEDVLMYNNDIHAGQSELYVVLSGHGLGLRVRESYAADIDKQQQLYESPGLLDLLLSAEPLSVLGGFDRESGRHAHCAGCDGLLLMRLANAAGSSSNQLDVARQAVEYFDGQQQPRRNHEAPSTTNLFNAMSSSDEMLLPKETIEGRVYRFYRSAQQPRQLPNVHAASFDLQLSNTIQTYKTNCCGHGGGVNNTLSLPPSTELGHPRSCCVHSLEQLQQACGGDRLCLYDMLKLQVPLLARMAHANQDQMKLHHGLIHTAHRSCGAINVEWPEFMQFGVSSGAKYLEGDTVRFECHHDYWVKGEEEFTCGRHGSEETGVYWRWSHGRQPWCRSRQLELSLKWMTAVTGTVAILFVLCFSFCCAASYSRRRRRLHNRQLSYIGSSSSSPIYQQAPAADEEPSALEYHDQPEDRMNTAKVPRESREAMAAAELPLLPQPQRGIPV